MTATSTDRAQVQGTRRQSLRVAPAPRQRQVPLMVLGILLVVGGALLFFLIAGRLDHRRPVLALAHPVPAGQVIKASDLRVVHIAYDGKLQVLSPAVQAQVVGKPAATSLSEGTLLIASDLGTGKGLQAGKAVVGLSLKAGQLPNAQLAPGDNVALVDTGDEGGPRVVGVVRVAEVSTSGGRGGTAYVSLLVDERDAPTIAAAGAAGRIVLVLVAQ